MRSTFVIVGGGQSAAQAATSLRELGFDGRLVLIGEEPALPYQRPPLSKKFLLGEIDADRLAIRPENHYRTLDIELVLGTRVEAVDRETARVALRSGASVAYDKLLLATGSRPRRLLVPGADRRGIHYLRGQSDAAGLRDELRPGRRLVIVGGGYIGLEIAAAARMSGMEVVILESAPRILGRVTGPTTAAFFAAMHVARGVEIRCGARIEGFEGGSRVSAVRCADGTLAADVVVVGVGAEACDEIARAAGLACENGIVVDGACRTADPRVFASGDCANFPHPLLGRRLRLECVHNAIEQGKTAALNMLERPHDYAAVPWFWSDQYDSKWQIVGLWDGYDDIVVRGAPESGAFACFYMREGRLIAVDAINSPRDFMACRRLIPQRPKVPLERLADPAVPLLEVA
jgi:3-phenylpropionate/trans-cinnamate dioxygenase ferredoxin reductase subunit